MVKVRGIASDKPEGRDNQELAATTDSMFENHVLLNVVMCPAQDNIENIATHIGRTLPAAAVEARVSACSVVKFILLHLPIQKYGHVSSSSSAIC